MIPPEGFELDTLITTELRTVIHKQAYLVRPEYAEPLERAIASLLAEGRTVEQLERALGHRIEQTIAEALTS